MLASPGPAVARRTRDGRIRFLARGKVVPALPTGPQRMTFGWTSHAGRLGPARGRGGAEMIRATVWTVGLFGAGTLLVRAFPGTWTEPIVLLALGLALLVASARTARGTTATRLRRAPQGASAPEPTPAAVRAAAAVPAPAPAPVENTA
jgi:hypothetical protein